MPVENKETYDKLIEEYRTSPAKFAFFVGAGLSIPIFPSWKSLLKKLLSAAQQNPNFHGESEIMELIEKGEQYLEVAEEVLRYIPEAKYRDILEETFDLDIDPKKVSTSYKKLFELQPKVIFTTNYDRIPNIISGDRYRFFSNKTASEALRVAKDGKPAVIKLHGDITDQSSIVLKGSDYDKLMHTNLALKNLLATFLSSKVFIFLGYSLNDPDINLALEYLKVANNNIPISHYIFVEGKANFRMNAFKNRFSINVINYVSADGTHRELEDFLSELGAVPGGEGLSSQAEPLAIPEYVREINSALETRYSNGSFSILWQDSTIYISLMPLGHTISELQNELLAFCKLFRSDGKGIENVAINLYTADALSASIEDNQKLIFTAVSSFENAHLYSLGNVTRFFFWNKLSVRSPYSICNPFQEAQELRFPLNLGQME